MKKRHKGALSFAPHAQRGKNICNGIKLEIFNTPRSRFYAELATLMGTPERGSGTARPDQDKRYPRKQSE